MIDYDALRYAESVNDALIGEQPDLGYQAVGDELSIDFPSVMMFGFEYAGQQSPANAPELFMMLHLAFCYGVFTVARAFRLEASAADTAA